MTMRTMTTAHVRTTLTLATLVLLGSLACLLPAASAAPPPPPPGPRIGFGEAWVPQGPAPMLNGQTESLTGPPVNPVIGAIHSVVTHPSNADIIIVGAVNGGIWRTTNGTAATPTWTKVTPDSGGQAIGVIEYDPSDVTNQTLLAGHGYMSSFGQGGLTNRNGLLRSTDGGATWATITDPLLQGANFVCAQARGATLLAGSNGFYNGTALMVRSTDTGASWTNISGVNNLGAGPVADLQGDAALPARLYAGVLQNGLFGSNDTGATWNNISAGDATLTGFLTAFSNNNIKLAVGPTGRLWVIVVNNGQASYIGFSTNPGAMAPTWTQMDLPLTNDTEFPGNIGLNPRAKPGSQGGTHLSLAADPVNANICYVGGDRQPRSFPNTIGALDFSGRLFRGNSAVAPAGAGVTFSPQWAHLTHVQNMGFAGGGTANNSAPHADSRDMAFDANGNLIEVDDGGIYRRTTPGTNAGDWFAILGNLQITEAHDVAYDTVSDILMCGNQDTGTAQQTVTGSQTWTEVPLVLNITGTNFAKADGGDVNVDPLNPAGGSTRFLSIQNLGIWTRQAYNAAGVRTAEAQPGPIPGTLIPQFKTPVELNRVNPLRVIVGAANDAYEDAAGTQGDGLVALGLGGVNRPGAIAYGAAGNADATYIGSGATVFVRTAAAGPFAATAPGGSVRDLEMDPNNFNNCAAVDSNQVFWTTNAGTNWADITGDLPAVGGVDFRTVVYVANPTDDGILVGTQNGVFGTLLSNLGVWYKVGTGLPDARIWELQYDATDDLLIASTMGRGVWVTPMLTTPTDLIPPMLACSLPRTLLWPPTRGMLPLGFSVTATDDQPPPPQVNITVYSDEPDGAAPYAPDAVGTMPANTRLRAERAYPGNGRVYLVKVEVFDAAGNLTSDCKSVIVPLMPTLYHIMIARAQAAAGVVACLAAAPGVTPAGYTQLLCYTAP